MCIWIQTAQYSLACDELFSVRFVDEQGYDE